MNERSEIHWANSGAKMSGWDVLVLGPGGIKGFVQIGALMALEDCYPGWRSKLKIISGVSVGAILGLYLICGLSMDEIVSLGLNLNMVPNLSKETVKDFINQKSLITKFGLFSNEPVKNQLTQEIEKKFGKSLTFQEMFDLTGIEFMVVTTGLNCGVKYISYRTFPNLLVVDGILRSMNIPGAFYQLRDETDIYIDGAFGNPYPIDQYDFGAHQVLGIAVEAPAMPLTEETGMVELMKYMSRSMNSSIRVLRDRNIRESTFRCQHLILKWPGIVDPLGLMVDAQTKAEMLIYGYQETQKFLGIQKNGKVKMA